MAQNSSILKEDNEEISSITVEPKKRISRFIRLIISIIIITSIIASIILVWAFFFKNKMDSEEAPQKSASSDASKELIFESPIFSNVMSFQVNLADGRRFLAVDIRLQLFDDDTQLYINRRMPIVNDLIISTLQRKTFTDLQKNGGITQLKNDLKRRLNSGVLFSEEFINIKGTPNPISNIFFDRFILQ